MPVEDVFLDLRIDRYCCEPAVSRLAIRLNVGGSALNSLRCIRDATKSNPTCTGVEMFRIKACWMRGSWAITLVFSAAVIEREGLVSSAVRFCVSLSRLTHTQSSLPRDDTLSNDAQEKTREQVSLTQQPFVSRLPSTSIPTFSRTIQHMSHITPQPFNTSSDI